MKKTKIRIGLALVILVLILTACRSGFTLSTQNLKRPTDRDVLMNMVAGDFKEPEFCEQISADAYVTAGLSPAGHQINYWKSECYYNIAAETGMKELCKQVIPLSTALLDGSAYTEANCMANVDAKRSHNDVTGPERVNDNVLVAFLKGMGYTGQYIADIFKTYNPNMVAEALADHPAAYPEFYQYLMFYSKPAEKQDFLNRAKDYATKYP